jgi:hypothetical protein
MAMGDVTVNRQAQTEWKLNMTFGSHVKFDGKNRDNFFNIFGRKIGTASKSVNMKLELNAIP